MLKKEPGVCPEKPVKVQENKVMVTWLKIKICDHLFIYLFILVSFIQQLEMMMR